MTPAPSAMLAETRRAFDSVAAEYDGPSGNNELIQYMRGELLRTVTSSLPVGSHLLDLGCGTGIDAAYLGRLGYRITAIDWSPGMVDASRRRVEREHLEERVSVELRGIHELDALPEGEFDAAYSGLGPLNCVPDLRAVAEQLATRLRPGGLLIASVINRDCPWEILNFALRGQFDAARRRHSPSATLVSLGDQRIWTRYYRPIEMTRELAPYFGLESYRALCWLAPPPYMVNWYLRVGTLGRLLARADSIAGKLPIVRGLGDHFLIVMRAR